MESFSLEALATEHLDAARLSRNGRSAQTLYGGRDHPLRQTLLALAAGHALDEHESPSQATLQVLRGRVRLGTSDGSWEGGAGDWLAIPEVRHDLQAVEDSVVLLTVSVRLNP